jgi:LuxR family maltose regulon positive regulatory protein
MSTRQSPDKEHGGPRDFRLGSSKGTPRGGDRVTTERKVDTGGTNGRVAAAPLDSFMETKLNPPRNQQRWVERPRLIAALDRAAGRPLTLVTAPAGYGKTTAVTQWISQLTDRAVAWVGIDQADNDPVRLWTHIMTALLRSGSPLEVEVPAFIAWNRTRIPSIVLPQIVNALAPVTDRVVIALEDFQYLHSAVCLEQVDFLLEHLPTSAAVVIITRADPALRTGRLRVSGRLAEIRADRLSFTTDEAASLLAVEGVLLSGGALSELMQRTEGWPAGLYRASLTLSDERDPDTLVHQLSGSNRFIGDYLTEEVLNRQPAAVRSFIVRSSVLDRLSAPLCDYVLESSTSNRLLHDLERSNLFLVPLDAKREWYRFNHLFAAVAQGELEAGGGEQVKILHGRAMQWFADHGFADDAIRHALAAGLTADAARLVQIHWSRYVDAGRAATVEAWLRALHAQKAEAEPGTLVTAAWMALLTGDEAGLNRLLLALGDLAQDGPLPDDTCSIQSAVAFIRAMSGHDGPVEMLAAGRRAVELETDETSARSAFANFSLGHALYVAGDLGAATEALQKAAYSSTATASVKMLALSILALAEREQAHAVPSRALALEAMEVVRQHALEAMPQASLAFTVWGESQAMEGDVSGAMATLEEGRRLRSQGAGLSPWPTIHNLLATARVATALGDLGQAERLLDEAVERMSRFSEGMEAMRARVTTVRSALRRQRQAEPDGEPLTDREGEVLRYLQSSLSLSEIAADLYLSRNTVKTHARAVYRKLGARSRAEAIRIGQQRSLI